jgi:cell division protein FtsB
MTQEWLETTVTLLLIAFSLQCMFGAFLAWRLSYVANSLARTQHLVDRLLDAKAGRDRA